MLDWFTMLLIGFVLVILVFGKYIDKFSGGSTKFYVMLINFAKWLFASCGKLGEGTVYLCIGFLLVVLVLI